MKTQILTIDGKKKSEIEMPSFFLNAIREDLIFKVLESQKIKQPYGPSPGAGNQYSASGILIHKRKVWKSQYGRGMSRVPRKSMSRKGSQFNWVGATVPNTRGGRRAHPPKVISMLKRLLINKKEKKLALISALSATANGKIISKRYQTLNDKKIENAPFIVESKLTELKTKDLINSIKKIVGEDLFGIVLRKKSIRSGKGTRRGRKYKSTAGLLLVIGKDENVKTTLFEVVKTNLLGVTNLAKGGPGRLTVYTEKAIKELGEKFK